MLTERTPVQRYRTTTPHNFFLTHKQLFSGGKCVCREWTNMLVITAEITLWWFFSGDQHILLFLRKHCWSEWSYEPSILFFRSTRKHNLQLKVSVRDIFHEILGCSCELASKQQCSAKSPWTALSSWLQCVSCDLQEKVKERWLARQFINVNAETVGITRSVQRNWAMVSQYLKQPGEFVCKANSSTLRVSKKSNGTGLGVIS